MLEEIVAGDVAPLADEVSERIEYGSIAVIDGDGAPEETNDQPRPAGDGEAEGRRARTTRDLFVVSRVDSGYWAKSDSTKFIVSWPREKIQPT